MQHCYELCRVQLHDHTVVMFFISNRFVNTITDAMSVTPTTFVASVNTPVLRQPSNVSKSSGYASGYDWTPAEPISVPEEQLLACPALQLELRELIGQGAFGKVFKACEANECRKVVKVQILKDKKAAKRFSREVEFMRTASNSDFGPRLFEACITDGIRLMDLFTGETVKEFRDQPSIGLTVSELWNGSLDELKLDDATWCSQIVLEKFQARVARMHSFGIVHSDLLPKNVLYKEDSRGVVTDLIPTDFGISFYATEFRDFPIEKQEWAFWYNLKDTTQPTWQVIEDTPELSNATLQDVQQNPFILDDPIIALLSRICTTL